MQHVDNYFDYGILFLSDIPNSDYYARLGGASFDTLMYTMFVSDDGLCRSLLISFCKHTHAHTHPHARTHAYSSTKSLVKEKSTWSRQRINSFCTMIDRRNFIEFVLTVEGSDWSASGTEVSLHNRFLSTWSSYERSWNKEKYLPGNYSLFI